jgi:8-hydroxy-5-deazaflavin:NADPH oxidoreductase
MRIGILGSGQVGVVLGSNWAQSGHHIHFGVRDPLSPDVSAVLALLGVNAEAASMANAVAASDVIVLAVPWRVVPEVLAQCGDLSGKILIDATNPLGMVDGRLSLVPTGHASGAAFVAAHAPAARVLKCFNQTGFENMADPSRYHPRPVMFAAGDDASAKQTVLTLIDDLGFAGIDAGPLATAGLLEALGALWINHAIVNRQGRSVAFALHQAG